MEEPKPYIGQAVTATAEQAGVIGTNTATILAANLFNHLTNPSKLSYLPQTYSELIRKAYDAIGATPLGEVFPEYAWYSSDVLSVMSYYGIFRIFATASTIRGEDRQRLVATVAAFTPAMYYELSQSSRDPLDILAYIIGITTAYFIDSKVSRKLAEIFDKPKIEETS